MISHFTKKMSFYLEGQTFFLVYNFNKMHKSQTLFNLTTALHVSGVTITHLQEHKTTVTTASGNRYTVLLPAAAAIATSHRVYLI